MSTGGGPNMMINVAGVAALAAITTVGYLVVVAPALQATQREQAVLKESSSASQRAQDEALKLLDSQRRRSQLERELERTTVQLILPSRVNEQIDRMTHLTAEHDLRLVRMSPGVAKRGQWYTAIPINMSGDGSFPSCAAFIESVRREFADVSIRGLKLTSKLDIASIAADKPAAETEQKPAESGTPTAFEFEFVWYAAADGSADAESANSR